MECRFMAQMRSLDVVSGGLNTEEERTWYGHARSSARDLEPTSKVRRGGARRSVNRPFAPSLFHPCEHRKGNGDETPQRVSYDASMPMLMLPFVRLTATVFKGFVLLGGKAG